MNEGASQTLAEREPPWNEFLIWHTGINAIAVKHAILSLPALFPFTERESEIEGGRVRERKEERERERKRGRESARAREGEERGRGRDR